MKINIDADENELVYEHNGRSKTMGLYTKESFEILSLVWIKVGWHQKYSYTFSWMGRPIIQLPEDLIRIQEVIVRLRPDVILETGIAHGGSLIYYASLCKILGHGRVIGVDIDLRHNNRQAIEGHDLFGYITLIDGDSCNAEVVKQVKSLIKPEEKVLVILDSCHHKEHVLRELDAYQDLIRVGYYAVVCDGIIKNLADVPRGQSEWVWDNPSDAAREFTLKHPEFAIEEPAWLFNESRLNMNISHWPGAWLRRVS